MGDILYGHDAGLVLPTREIVDYGPLIKALRDFKEGQRRGIGLAPAAARFVSGEGNVCLDGLKRLVIAYVNGQGIDVYVASSIEDEIKPVEFPNVSEQTIGGMNWSIHDRFNRAEDYLNQAKEAGVTTMEELVQKNWNEISNAYRAVFGMSVGAFVKSIRKK